MSGPPPLWLGTFRLRPDLRDPSHWSDAEHGAVSAHLKRLQQGAAEGRVLFAGRTDDRDGAGWLAEATIGIAVFAAEGRAAAESYINDDPAVVAGVMTATVQSYRLAVSRD